MLSLLLRQRRQLAIERQRGLLSRCFWSTRVCAAEQTLSIDTSGLQRPHAHRHGDVPGKEPETEMTKHLKSIIRFRGGPITLAEYMSEVLTNPRAGYYINRDVFGTAGDFTTSPEISQLFGEMIGIWCLTVWQQIGAPSKMQVVELGPGRGTLMADLLRGTSNFKPFSSGLTVHLVEVSSFLRKRQWERLQCTGPTPEDADQAQVHGTTPSGIQVHWHRSLEEVPEQLPTVYIAHEFMDALPVHQFQKTERGWCERLVDIASDDSPLHLRLVLAPRPTPASKLLVERRLAAMPFDQKAAVKGLEVSPQVMTTAGDLATRVAQQGGAALIVDYGRNRPYPASLQAIRQHKFCGLLEQPGHADLSAHVDFTAIRQGVEDSQAAASCHGPISQRQLLQSLGIEARLEALLQNATPAEADMLQTGYMRLVGGGKPSPPAGTILHGVEAAQKQSEGQEDSEADTPDGMGLTYQALAITSSTAATPVAFDA